VRAGLIDSIGAASARSGCAEPISSIETRGTDRLDQRRAQDLTDASVGGWVTWSVDLIAGSVTYSR
jgi:hypothetical protein